jgi:DNA anti-recombination protein RmuC
MKYERYLIAIPMVSLLLTSYSCLVVIPERRRQYQEIERKFDARLEETHKKLDRTSKRIDDIMKIIKNDMASMQQEIDTIKKHTSNM